MNYQMKHITFALQEVKQLQNPGEFEGYLSTFGNIDYDDDVVVKGAFDKSLEQWRAKGQMPGLLWMHRMDSPVGEWLEIRPDERGLWVKGALWVDGNQMGRTPLQDSIRAHNMTVSNGPKGMSIGFIPTKVSFGRQEEKEVRFLEEVDLMEGSLVPFGANDRALVTSAKMNKLTAGDEIPSKRDVEKFLRDAGFSRSQAKAFLARGYEGLDQREAEADFIKSIHDLTQMMKG